MCKAKHSPLIQKQLFKQMMGLLHEEQLPETVIDQYSDVVWLGCCSGEPQEQLQLDQSSGLLQSFNLLDLHAYMTWELNLC